MIPLIIIQLFIEYISLAEKIINNHFDNISLTFNLWSIIYNG